MATITDLLPDVLAADIPEAVAERALLRAAGEFCRETLAWQVPVSAVAVPTTGILSLSTLTSDLEVCGVVRLRMQGSDIVPASPAAALELREQSGTPAWVVLGASPRTLEVLPHPASAGTADCVVAVAPTLATATIPDSFLQRWHGGVVALALHQLYSMPRAWASPAIAAAQRVFARDYMARAKREAADGGLRVARVIEYGGY